MDKVVRRALNHPNVLGAGARKRSHLSSEHKAQAIVGEYKRGTLHSGSGAIVKEPS